MTRIRLDRKTTNWATARKDQVKKNEAGGKAFTKALSQAREEELKDELEGLLAEIKEHGERLKKNLTGQNFLQFKKKVSKFLRLLSKEFWQVKKEEVWQQSSGFRSYQLVDKVEEEIEELRDLIMEEQADQLAIIDKIDGIAGLVFQLYS
ncbi:MAG: YaaR family protein [Halanaerobium sp.]|nr:YaaR family protein [Halanaerobium sp.]